MRVGLPRFACACPAVSHPAPQSMGFPRQEQFSGLPFPSPGGPSQPKDQTRLVAEQLSLCTIAIEARAPRTHALQQEEPPQWEARTPQLESSACSSQPEKALVTVKTLCSQKQIKLRKIYINKEWPWKRMFCRASPWHWWWFQLSGGSRRPVSMSIYWHRWLQADTSFIKGVAPPIGLRPLQQWCPQFAYCLVAGIATTPSIFPVPPSLYCLGGETKSCLRNLILPANEVEIMWKEQMAAHSSILAWKITWTEEPGGLQSVGSQRVWHNWATNT